MCPVCHLTAQLGRDGRIKWHPNPDLLAQGIPVTCAGAGTTGPDPTPNVNKERADVQV